MPVSTQKLRRGSGRVLARSRSFVTKIRVHRHDFSFQNRSENPFIPNGSTIKIKILGLVAGLILLSVAGLLLFHPTFRIGVITITGLERTSYEEVRSTAENILNSKRFGFLPRNNYFLVNKEELQGIVADRFLLSGVEVSKKFPDSILITVHERQPVAVVLKEGMFTAVDENGLAVEKLGRSIAAPWTAFPLLTYAAEVQNNSERDKEFVGGVLAWNHFMVDSLGTQVLNYTIETPTSGTITTKEGWRVLANFADNREAQFTALNAAFKQKDFNAKSLQYIDVRYPGKVFWQ